MAIAHRDARKTIYGVGRPYDTRDRMGGGEGALQPAWIHAHHICDRNGDVADGVRA